MCELLELLMLNFHQLVRLPQAEMNRLDIAILNLASASGLPGADRIDWKRNLAKLDEWAGHCQRFTEGMMPHFHRGRCDYPNSEPKFRIQAMVTHLQRDIGIRFHPGRKRDEDIFQPEDSFVYGVVQGEGGTCGNLPIVYAAIGRRMGYPLKLVATRCHSFCRWDDGTLLGDRFNIEASGEGVSFFEDEHYRSGSYSMPSETVRICGYLQSFSPREEVASFISQRGECWVQEKNYREATHSFVWAHELDPRRQQYAFQLQQAIQNWNEVIESRLPSREQLPKLTIDLPPRQFRYLPHEVERDIIGLTVMEHLMNDVKSSRRWWEPMRKNPNLRPADLPQLLRAEYSWDS